MRKLLGLDKKKPAKKQTKNKAPHSEIKKLLTSPSIGTPVSGFSPSCQENTVGLLSALANETIAKISNGGLNTTLSPFKNCTAPGSSPGVTPENGEGSNRKGRRKNIKNSRQLSQMNNIRKNPGLPRSNVTRNPVVNVPDQEQQQLSCSQQQQQQQEQLEHSTFDCTVCRQSVCKLLGHINNNVVEESSIDNTCHVCEYCSMAFPSGQKLKSHLRCHIKPFPCTVCNKSFTNSGKDIRFCIIRASYLCR